jgi:hypothetical protein
MQTLAKQELWKDVFAFAKWELWPSAYGCEFSIAEGADRLEVKRSATYGTNGRWMLTGPSTRTRMRTVW